MADSTQQGSESMQVFQRFKIIGVLDVILASSLLICGIVGAIYGDGGYFGPPYFVGSFVTGVIFLLKGIYLINLYKKGTSGATALAQLLSCSTAIIMFGFMSCLVGIALSSISGVYSSCDRNWFSETDIACASKIGKYRSVAIPALILIILCAVLNIYTLYYLCTNQSKFGVNFRMGRMTTQQMAMNNQMLMMQNQMLMQQMAAQGQAGHIAGQNYSGVHMGTSSYAGSAYPMGPNPGYPMGPAAGYPMGSAAGFTMGPTTGYPMGPGIPPPEQQFPGPYPQPEASYPPGPIGLSSDVKIDLNQPPEQPSAPPPSYESVTKQ
ncbi:uncharacterized protein LOC127733858 [Mytilus californianus]|uniref:uncharacterized protein LOC127733858 n=1 Tax=Mytilus californianus TaxID=6549 RepID=UPI00224531AF|nr:uncharacterized protein LOC127733858 [Mytilus californianus]XP_052099235.1 uncharacterized protein LOC127733858 [Mytilus californianus]